MEKFTYSDYLKYISKMSSCFYLSDVSVEYKLEKIHQPKDKGYKVVLTDKREACQFINNALKKENTQYELKEENIELYSSSFITQDFKSEESDIIYKKKDQNIFFLIEHQSKVDYSMSYRITEYCVEIIRKSINQEKARNKSYKIPAVYPIVLYTGNKKWNAKIYLEQCQEKLAGTKVESFASYNLIDINNYTEEDLWKQNNVLSRMLLLEKSNTKEKLEKYFEKIKDENLTNNQLDLIIQMIHNLKSKEMSKDIIEKFIKLIKNRKEVERMASPLEVYLDSLVEKGKKVGRREGRNEGDRKRLIMVVKNMLKSNINEKIIKQITEISQKELEEIKKAI